MVLRNARIGAASEVIFEGKKILLKEHHVVITMNPDYAGRAELPNNLQVKVDVNALGKFSKKFQRFLVCNPV